MATAKRQDVELKLKNVRLSACFLPGKQGYFIVALTDKGSEQYKQAAAAVMEAAKAAYGEKAAAMVKQFSGAGSQKMCFLPGESRVDNNGDPFPGTEGKFTIAASNKTRPLLLLADKTEVDAADEATMAKYFYSGGIYNVNLAVYAANFRSKEGQQITGLFASLKGVQFVRHQERLGGGARIASKDEFDDVSDPDAAGADDLTGGDDIPF